MAAASALMTTPTHDIGEMRDVETFITCMSAAETGHFVFSTLQTTNDMMTIDRILDFFPADQHVQVRSQFAYSRLTC